MALTQIPGTMVAPDAGLTRANMGADAALPAGLGPFPYAGASAPAGWLLCYGQAISRTTYAALFAAIGTAFGAGDGSMTFNVPDCRGRVPAGKDNMGGTAASRLTTAGSGVDGSTLGAVGGAQTHTLDTTQIPAHNHTLGSQSDGTAGSSTAAITGANGNRTSINPSGNAGGGLAHNNTQPTIITNYIIKT